MKQDDSVNCLPHDQTDADSACRGFPTSGAENATLVGHTSHSDQTGADSACRGFPTSGAENATLGGHTSHSDQTGADSACRGFPTSGAENVTLVGHTSHPDCTGADSACRGFPTSGAENVTLGGHTSHPDCTGADSACRGFPTSGAENATLVGQTSHTTQTDADSACRGFPAFPVAAVSRLRMATDGEGVTTLVCAWGCPLRCRYCINKFTWDGKTKIRRMTPEALYDEVKKDSLYFEATGGGITFGGGEPLLYADFIPAFRALCGSRWKLTAETSLSVPEENLRTAAASLDSFIVDIKDTDPAVYRAYTGRDITPAIRNLQLLLALTDPAHIRVRLPLIPGYNTDAHRDRSEALLRDMGITNIERFNYIIKENEVTL